MKNQIKDLAIRLFTLKGYRGVSFGDITDRLNTTRANIHYHFKSKNGLAESVLDAAVDDVLTRYRTIWTNHHSSLNQKLQESLAFNKERYQRYNTSGEGRVWSLITRFRMDMDVITPKMIARLNEVTLKNEFYVEMGVQIALDNGELREDAPLEDIALQIACIVHFAPLISQAPHNFERLEKTYLALMKMIEQAYAKP